MTLQLTAGQWLLEGFPRCAMNKYRKELKVLSHLLLRVAVHPIDKQ